MRVYYLDALKGVALFIMLLGIVKPDSNKWFSYHIIIDQFEHVGFTGLHLLDMVLPVFIFCSGTGFGLRIRNISSIEAYKYYLIKSVKYFILAAVLYFKAFNGPYYRVDSVLFTFSILYAINIIIYKISIKSLTKIFIFSVVLHAIIEIYVGLIDNEIIYSYRTNVFLLKDADSIILLIARIIGIINLYIISYLLTIYSPGKLIKYAYLIFGLLYFVIVPVIPKIFSNHLLFIALFLSAISEIANPNISQNIVGKILIKLGRATLFIYIITTGWLKEIFQTIDLFGAHITPAILNYGVVRSITFILMMISLAYWYNNRNTYENKVFK